jgi:hypothetical protein
MDPPQMRQNNTYARASRESKAIDDALSAAKPVKSLTTAPLKSFSALFNFP